MKTITKASLVALALLSATFASSACSRDESAAPRGSPGSEPSVGAKRTTIASPDSRLRQPGAAGAAASGSAAPALAPTVSPITVLRALQIVAALGAFVQRGEAKASETVSADCMAAPGREREKLDPLRREIDNFDFSVRGMHHLQMAASATGQCVASCQKVSLRLPRCADARRELALAKKELEALRDASPER